MRKKKSKAAVQLNGCSLNLRQRIVYYLTKLVRLPMKETFITIANTKIRGGLKLNGGKTIVSINIHNNTISA